jgi:hypothetical protein
VGLSQQFLRHHLLEHHSQQVWSRPPFGAWGREEKQKNCKKDNVSMQQLRYLTVQQGSNFIPGGFNYMRIPFAHYPMTPRTNGKASVNSMDGSGELFLFAFPAVSLSARGLSLLVISSLGRASDA